MRLSHRAFERLVADALDTLPDAILHMLDNVAVVVADEPTPHQIARARLEEGMTLLGLYEGIPLTERTSAYGSVLPDKVTIFQRALEDAYGTPEALIAQVRHTVVHELAHHLGISDARLIDLGYETDPYADCDDEVTA
jgi:predicted Zn-dependent protease with MMP-like domain